MFVWFGGCCGAPRARGSKMLYPSDLGAAAFDGPAPSLADLLAPDGAGSLPLGRQPLRG